MNCDNPIFSLAQIRPICVGCKLRLEIAGGNVCSETLSAYLAFYFGHRDFSWIFMSTSRERIWIIFLVSMYNERNRIETFHLTTSLMVSRFCCLLAIEMRKQSSLSSHLWIKREASLKSSLWYRLTRLFNLHISNSSKIIDQSIELQSDFWCFELEEVSIPPNPFPWVTAEVKLQ